MITLDRLEQKIDALTSGLNSLLASHQKLYEFCMGDSALKDCKLAVVRLRNAAEKLEFAAKPSKKAPAKKGKKR